MEQGNLSFATDNEYLGVVFQNLRGKRLYPAVATLYGDCEITMTHLGSLEREFCKRAAQKKGCDGCLFVDLLLGVSFLRNRGF